MLSTVNYEVVTFVENDRVLSALDNLVKAHGTFLLARQLDCVQFLFRILYVQLCKKTFLCHAFMVFMPSSRA